MSDYTQHSSIKAGSEKSFGLVFGLVFGIIAVWPLFSGGSVRFWALAVAIGFLLVAYVKPVLLGPLNLLWFKLGIFLGKFITPVVMSILFLTTVTPIAILLKVFGKDPLRLKLDSKAMTYWIERAEPGPPSGSMRNQF